MELKFRKEDAEALEREISRNCLSQLKTLREVLTGKNRRTLYFVSCFDFPSDSLVINFEYLTFQPSMFLS